MYHGGMYLTLFIIKHIECECCGHTHQTFNLKKYFFNYITVTNVNYRLQEISKYYLFMSSRWMYCMCFYPEEIIYLIDHALAGRQAGGRGAVLWSGCFLLVHICEASCHVYCMILSPFPFFSFFLNFSFS